MKLSQFKFNLPKDLLAEYPAKNREDARLMVIHRQTKKIEHKKFKDIINYFEPDDTMVVTTNPAATMNVITIGRKSEGEFCIKLSFTISNIWNYSTRESAENSE